MLVLVNILLIITAIVLVIVFSLLLIPIEDIRRRLEVTVNQDLEEAKRLLIIAATLDLAGFVLIIAMIIFAYRAGKTKCKDSLESKIKIDLYYQRMSTRFGIFLVFIASVVAALLSEQAKRKLEGSNIPTNTKNTISKHIQTSIGINWAIAIKLVLTFIFTFLGPKREVLRQTLAKEQLKQELKKSTVQLIATQSAPNVMHPVQLTPIVQCSPWGGMPGPVVTISLT